MSKRNHQANPIVLAGEKLPDEPASARQVLGNLIGRRSTAGIRFERIGPGRYRAEGKLVTAEVRLAGYGQTRYNDADVDWRTPRYGGDR